MITRLQEEVRKAYISAIGRPRQEIVTPALVLDLDVARQNIHTMAKCLAECSSAVRIYCGNSKMALAIQGPSA